VLALGAAAVIGGPTALAFFSEGRHADPDERSLAERGSFHVDRVLGARRRWDASELRGELAAVV
jgi:hypothetical protein